MQVADLTLEGDDLVLERVDASLQGGRGKVVLGLALLDVLELTMRLLRISDRAAVLLVRALELGLRTPEAVAERLGLLFERVNVVRTVLDVCVAVGQRLLQFCDLLLGLLPLLGYFVKLALTLVKQTRQVFSVTSLGFNLAAKLRG